MPEGPSIVILKEALREFENKKIVEISGSAAVAFEKIQGQKIISFKSWGKHLLICLPTCTIRVHLLLFGTYRINEKRPAKPRMHLQFQNGEINFYACSIKLLEEKLENVYDFSADVMNDKWSAAKARKKLKAIPRAIVSDVLLNQEIYAGVGNIIKNEVLFRIRVHPKSKIGSLPNSKITALSREARKYSFQFLEWKKGYVLRKHWLVYGKKTCPRCQIPLIKKAIGKSNRRTFFCNNCQVLY